MARRSGRLAATVLALTFASSGCVSGGGMEQRTNPFENSAGSDEVLLTVQNNDFRDASIYAVWNGVRKRVGSVTGMTSETFRMQWQSEEIQLAVDFLGGGGYVSERVPVVQGDHLDFVIMADGSGG